MAKTKAINWDPVFFMATIWLFNKQFAMENPAIFK